LTATWAGAGDKLWEESDIVALVEAEGAKAAPTIRGSLEKAELPCWFSLVAVVDILSP
jgi:hypothetical protein